MQHKAAVRDDISKFVVHLTRNSNGKSAFSNLISILKDKVIFARNAHCLFKHLIEGSQFSNVLQKSFNTVCFTETPFTQIHKLVRPVPGRQIELKPYGLVFSKETLLSMGACPVIYINSISNSRLRSYLLEQFRENFSGIHSLSRLQDREPRFHKAIIQYYSLINIIGSNYDFSWEREWRFQGDFRFRYLDLLAIIAPNPDRFERMCLKRLSNQKGRYIKKIPIISPDWSYEDIVETMSIQIWNNAKAKPIPSA